LDPLTKQSLRDVRTQYLDQLMADGTDIEDIDEDEVG